MARHSWFTLAGSVALVAALAVGVVGRSAVRAVGPSPDAETLQVADLPACGPDVGRGGAPGSAPTVTALLNESGTLVGWTLGMQLAGEQPLRIGLPAESSVSEPLDGRVVVTADDGARSTISIVSAAAGCATPVARLDAVVRSGIQRARDGAVWFHAVDRSSRRDLGVWSVGTPGAAPERVVAALGARDPVVRAVGPVFTTALRLDGGGDRLAVQSCGARTCRTRVIDLDTRREWRIETAKQGPLIAFERTRATFSESCPAAPCPLRAVLFDPTTSLPGTESAR